MNLEEILKDKESAMQMKKAQIKHADVSITPQLRNGITSKSEIEKKDTNSITKTIVGNTYYYLDSHEDLHVKGVFTKTIKERSDRIFHLHDHEFKLTAKVGEPQNIYEKEVSWKELGVNADGMTVALFMDTEIMKDYNSQIFDLYNKGEINQHSVGMQYHKIELAVNSDKEELKREKEIWDKYYQLVLNKEDADKLGYMWIVKEASLIEISAVLLGSNPITPTIESKEEPSNHSKSNNDPADKFTGEQKFINKLKS